MYEGWISPLEQLSDATVRQYLSERAFIHNCGIVEGALTAGMNVLGIVPDEAASDIIRAALEINVEEVATEEGRTRHQIRAVVNVIRAHSAPAHRRFVHLGATSSDISDTANAFRYKNFVRDKLSGMLDGDQTRLLEAATSLPGKISGAVGNYAAFKLLTPHPRALELMVLGILGLQPRIPSTQIVQPEGWADLGEACVLALGRMAHYSKFAKDLWLQMIPRLQTLYMDQISEHQRDLTNSASQRFTGEILAATYIAAREVQMEQRSNGIIEP